MQKISKIPYKIFDSKYGGIKHQVQQPCWRSRSLRSAGDVQTHVVGLVARPSDTQLEHALKVRLDFVVFTGFEPGHGSFPDASTICRIRNRLVTASRVQAVVRLAGANDPKWD